MVRLVGSSSRITSTSLTDLTSFVLSDPYLNYPVDTGAREVACVSNSGTRVLLSSIDVGRTATYRVLPCPSSTDTGQHLLITHRAYPTPPPLPIIVHLCSHENPQQRTILETGFALWDATVYLLRYLSQNSYDLPENVLEVGCGTGYLGIYLSLIRPGLTSTVTDLPYMKSTVEENVALNPDSDTAFRELDWSRPDLYEGEDHSLIVAADCIYLSELVDPFCTTLLTLLKKTYAGKRQALIAHQIRGGAGSIEEDVERRLREGGMRVEVVEWRDGGYETERLMIWRVEPI